MEAQEEAKVKAAAAARAKGVEGGENPVDDQQEDNDILAEVGNFEEDDEDEDIIF